MGTFFHLGPGEAYKSSAQSHPLNTNNSRYAVLWKIIHTTIAILGISETQGWSYFSVQNLKWLFTSDFANLFTYSNSITRGHSLKQFKSFSKLRCRYDYFSNRIVNNWNSLPENVVNSSTVNCFKSCIDTHLINSKFIFV